MRNTRYPLILLIIGCLATSAMAEVLSSPDGRIQVRFDEQAGVVTYAVSLQEKPVIEPSPLGIETDDSSWSTGLKLAGVTAPAVVRDEYRLLHGKRRDCRYVANRCVLSAANADGLELRIVFQASNDGVAFRYEIPRLNDLPRTAVRKETTGFDLPQESRGWLLPMDEGQSGWSRVHPAYERFHELDVSVDAPSPTAAGWAFPALFRVRDHAWVLLMEAGVDGGYCGSRLSSPSADGLYRIAFPDPRENNDIGSAEPTIELPFKSPWRVIIIGESLGAIVESTLVTDLVAPQAISDASFVKPGKATWSWLREKDPATVFDRQKDYVDLAARLGFEYCLVDARWDAQIGYDRIAELVRYAASHGVHIILWYNSNGNWNDAPQSPKDRMHERDARRAEFQRLRELGVKGVKIDFFGGDKQATMQLYMDILRDAADHEILVNFHGSTIPRGWERTWPHLVTMEGVRGYEFFTFAQDGADQAPQHCCVVPFTRNVIGPMDFTPTCLGEHLNTKGTVTRRTRDGFDLALAVVYESGIQHFGLTPDDIANAPPAVVDYLRSLPATWDDIHFIEGWPGRYVVLARRSGQRWFVAGINGQDQAQTVDLDLAFAGDKLRGLLLADTASQARATSASQPATAQEISKSSSDTKLEYRILNAKEAARLKAILPPRGGFVLRLEP